MEGKDDVMLRPISLGQRLRASTALQAAAVALVAVPLASLPAAAQLSPTAHPTGGSVVAGQASIGQNGNTTTIGQSSQRAAVNWQSFDVGSQSTVQFQQPSASAVTLNRVVGPNPSEIAGKIQANGQLVIVNQAGLVFDKGSQINAAGLIASAAGISNSNFMAGKMVFDQAAKAGAMVENRGTITVNQQGLAALVAPRVRNSGKIQATMGTVILAGAEAETLDLYGDGLVSINVTKQVASAPDGTKALVTNSGVIEAHGGKVLLTADAVDGVVQTLVDAGGRIDANSTASRTGRVLITGAGGDVRVEGVVTAQGTAPGTAGGEVKVSGSNATIVGPHAKISVSGQAGGGTVALGTTLKRARGGGTGTAAATTQTLVVNSGATISADAKANGNGGRIVALASGTTTMAGTITAKGGAQGGNGGYVEISGGTVSPLGHIDTTAPKGSVGTLSLDPTDIWVSDTEPAGTTPSVSWFSPASLETQATNIVLVANGNLNVASSFGTGNTLNLGSYSLYLFGQTGLTVDRGFGVAANGITLQTGTGPITLNGASGVSGGLITAGQLAMLSPTSIGVPAGQMIVVNSGANIALGAATIGSQGVPVQELDLYAAAGGIAQDQAGAIFANTLRTGPVVGDVGLLGTGNQIANLPYASVTGGGFSLVDSSPLNVTYAAGNNVFLQVTGGNALTLTTGGQVTTMSSSTGRVSLVADALNVPESATVKAGTVEIAPNTPGTPVSLLPSAPPADTLTIDSELLSRLSTTTLRVGGYTNPGGGTVTATSGSVDIASTLNLTGIATGLDLQSLGPVTQEGPLTVRTLTGGTGVVTLTDPGNTITNLGNFTAPSLTLIDPDVTGSLHVVGRVTVPTLSLTAPDIAIAAGGIVVSLGTTTLIANGPGGTITEGGAGIINSGLLTGSANGGVTLDGANNVVQLGAFSPGGNFLLNNGQNALLVAGAFSGAGDTMTLNAGLIQQTGAGIITAGALTGSATDVNLSAATGGNQIATLGDFAVTGGNFILTDATPLAVNGAVSANTIFLREINGDGLTLAATGSLVGNPSGGLVTLVADGLDAEAGGRITAPTVEIAPNTVGFPVSVAPASPPASTLTIAQAALTAIDTTTLRIGAFTDAPAAAATFGSPTAGSIDFAAAVNLTGAASILDLETTGAVTQGGPLVVNELTGRAGPLTLTTPGNDISYLGAFAAGGPFDLVNGANPLEIIGAFSGAGQTMTLTTGALSQTAAGIVTAQELTGSAAGVDLSTASGGNDIATLGPFAPGGNFNLNNGANPLQIVGAFSGAGDTLTLTTGALSQSAAGIVTAQELTGSALGVDLSTASGGNNISTLGPFSPGGNFNLNNGANALQIVGAFAGAGDTLTLNAGPITQTIGGQVTAATLTGAASALDLSTATNAITNIGPFTALGGFALNDNVGALTVVGAIDGGPFVTLANTGALAIDAPIDPTNTVALYANGITQSTAGIITAGTLTGDAGAGAADLGTAVNLVSDLGPFNAATGFTLNDSVPALTVIGPVNGGSGVTLANTGSLGIDAALTATGTVALTAVGIAQTADGVIDAGTLTGDAGSGAATLAAATNLVTDLGPFNAGGAFSLLDGADLTVIGTITAGADATIAVTGAGNGLTVNAGVTIQSATGNTVALSTTGGDIDNAGSLTGGVLASLNSGGGIGQSGVVTANAITETAANGIDHSGNSIAGAGAISLTAGGAINQSASGGLGTIEAIGGNVSLTANAIAQQAGALILDPTAGQTIGLTSATGIAFAGTIAAAPAGNLTNPGGTVSLTAKKGGITETDGGSHTGLVSALTLTGAAPAGSVLLDAPSPTGTANQVVNLGSFPTGGAFTLIDGHSLTLAANLTVGTNASLLVNGSGNAITLPSGIAVTAGNSASLASSGGNLTDNGTITAPNIQLAAPLGTASVSGTLAGVVPDPTLNPLNKLANGTFPSNLGIGAWIIGGNIVLAPSIKVTGAGGGSSQLVIDLTNPNGLANLGNFDNKSTDLYLDLGLGTASGQIAVRALQVLYTPPGTSTQINLLGTVGGYSGYTAAAASFIYPHINNNYRLNGCPISATNCLQIPQLQLPSLLFPFINPLKDLEVDSPEESDDILIILPDVGERDY
jgi:filamentous hemagglutinin family protein